MSRIDIVTVFHNETNRAQATQLVNDVQRHEPDGDITFSLVDNRVHNRGFARGCNLGAFHPEARSPIIGFLNPDTQVEGPFIDKVTGVLNEKVVITGCRFGKPALELRIWGVQDWACGATFFVKRDWFTRVGGFDEQFEWSFEETDLIRTAEKDGFVCRSQDLPLRHDSPKQDTAKDAAYKRHHFVRSQRRFNRKWGI